MKDFSMYINFYSSFDSPTTLAIKELLEKNGWTSRKESWEDFELSNEWSELNLFTNETQSLLKGTIKSPEINYKKLIGIFHSINARFVSELYDENNTLIQNDKVI